MVKLLRLLEVKPYIDILATTLPIANYADLKRDGEQLSEIMSTKDEWKLLRDLYEILKGFAKATTYLGVRRLNLNVPFNITEILEKIKLHLYNTMELYWNKEEEETFISALLDSRIKSLGFVDNEEVRNKIKDLLKNKYD
ncbi:hypothetical protein C1646_767275 [Rhizophagus diaphanus]|nr:hypothetical protein C1646_767275 [Rhizophagus diaphanus] [Rhizophagus sp. MUCL 43196]